MVRSRRINSAPEGRVRKLARKHTPIVDALVLKQYWGVEISTRGAKVIVPVPVVMHQTLHAVRLSANAAWLREICFGAKYPGAESMAAIRIALMETRSRVVHTAAAVLEAEGGNEYAGECGGDGGRAALGMSDDDVDSDAVDDDDDLDPDAKGDEYRRVGVHLRPWISVTIHDTVCQIVRCKRQAMLLHATSEGLSAFAGAIHAIRKRAANDQTVIKPYKTFPHELTFDVVFTDPADKLRFRYVED